MSIRALLGLSRLSPLFAVPVPLISHLVRRMCGQPHSAETRPDTNARVLKGTPEMLNEGGQSLRLARLLTFNEQFVAEVRTSAWAGTTEVPLTARVCFVEAVRGISMPRATLISVSRGR